jgi:hypothetical protein
MSPPPAQEGQDFYFVITTGLDGRHRWYLHNPSGTIIDSHTNGFATELEAHQDIERVRNAVVVAPIIHETPRLDPMPTETSSAL